MQTSFFNTIGINGAALVEATARTMKQDEVILSIFKEYPRTAFTPFDIQYNVKRIYNKDYPITSVRRSMSVLTDQGKLVKSDKAEGKGIYKVANHKWTLC